MASTTNMTFERIDKKLDGALMHAAAAVAAAERVPTKRERGGRVAFIMMTSVRMTVIRFRYLTVGEGVEN